MEIRDNKLLCNKPVDATLSTGAGQFRAYQASNKPSFLIRNDGANTYFMVTNASDPWGSYNNLRPLFITNANGYVTIGHKLNMSAGSTYPHIYGNNSYLCLGAVNDSNYNLAITKTVVRGTGTAATNVTNMYLGDSTHRWRGVYLQTSPNVSSDRNMKNTIQDLPEQLMVDFVNGLKPSSFIFNCNDSGRTHYGLISQDVEDLLDKLGIPSQEFAGFIKSPQEEILYNDEGDEIGTQVVEGKYSYSLRYEEFIAPIIKALQYALKEIETLKSQAKGGNANG